MNQIFVFCKYNSLMRSRKICEKAILKRAEVILLAPSVHAADFREGNHTNMPIRICLPHLVNHELISRLKCFWYSLRLVWSFMSGNQALRPGADWQFQGARAI